MISRSLGRRKLVLLRFQTTSEIISLTFVVNFFNGKMFLKQTVSSSRKLQVQYLVLLGNDSRFSIRRPSYSLFIRASLANPLFPCSCPIGILGNLSITSKWSPFHLDFHSDLLAKYGARLHLWKSKVARIALVEFENKHFKFCYKSNHENRQISRILAGVFEKNIG